MTLRTLAILIMASLAATTLCLAADDEAELIALDKKWGEANVNGDVATLDKIYADDVILIGGGGVAGKAQALEGAKQNAGKTTDTSYTTDNFKIVFLDENTAIMTHHAVAKGKREGESFENDHNSLHVFVKRDGRWQVMANAGVPISN